MENEWKMWNELSALTFLRVSLRGVYSLFYKWEMRVRALAIYVSGHWSGIISIPQGRKIPFTLTLPFSTNIIRYLDKTFSKIWVIFFRTRLEVEILPPHISHSRDQLCKSLTREYISTCFNKYLLNTKMVLENKTWLLSI